MEGLYRYEPLPGTCWIRLLDILPAAARSNRLEGTLRQVELTDREIFETLSYTWGQEEAGKSVFVDGKRIAVTPNCSNAVQNLRRVDSSRTFWIDAICINQADKAEKGQQVSMMGEIYSKSQRTVVYLGAGDGTVHLLRDNAQIKPGSIAFAPGRQADLEAARQKLLGRNWYHRKWIIQEVLLSRDVIAQAGKHEFTWAELETLDNHGLEIFKLAKKYLHPSSLSSMQVNGHEWDPKAKAAWEEMFEQGEVIAMNHRRVTNQANLPRYNKYRSPQMGFLMPPQLFDVLCLTSNFACKEPRDRLFAVLSLFVQKLDLLLDYTCDEEKIYESLTKELLSLGDTRMFWLDDRESWRPRWTTALSTLADFVRLKGSADTVSRPATDIGRLVKEAHQERRAGVVSIPSATTWKVSGVLLGCITSIASESFVHRTAPSGGGPWPGAAHYSRPHWESILKSLGLGRATDHENGLYPLAHVHQRNRINLEWFRHWTLDLLSKRGGSTALEAAEESKAIQRAAPHHHGHLKFCNDMKMFQCDDNGLVGLVPQTVRLDDMIWFLPGHTCPFVVLRPNGTQLELVGLCWLGPLKLFPCCFHYGDYSSPLHKERWITLEIT